jgi:hypothetical protein
MTLNDFKNWALSQRSVATPIGTYKGECVSLIQQYLSRVYDIPFKVRGNAVDWSSNSDVLQYFDVVSDLNPGDILVYNLNDGIGHIEIYLGNNQSLQQNRRLDGKVHVEPLFTKYPYKILRRKGGEMKPELLNEGDSYNVTSLFGEGDKKRFEGQAWSAVFYNYALPKLKELTKDKEFATWVANERYRQINELLNNEDDAEKTLREIKKLVNKEK